MYDETKTILQRYSNLDCNTQIYVSDKWLLIWTLIRISLNPKITVTENLDIIKNNSCKWYKNSMGETLKLPTNKVLDEIMFGDL